MKQVYILFLSLVWDLPFLYFRRGLNPPHRIKSISMASFNDQEIEFLEKHGNEVCFLDSFR